MSSRRIAARRGRGFTLLELLVVITIISILSAIALPLILGAREKARNAVCDDVYTSLAPEVINELDTVVLEGGQTSCGTSTGNSQVVSCTVLTHQSERNPRNRNEQAFVVTGPANTCAVQLVASGTQGVQFVQTFTTAASVRTFTVVVD